jgi:uncharacterized membrane protein
MTTLVAVAFPHETTASAAAEDVRRAALDVSVGTDALAVVSRDGDGALHLTTTQRTPGRTSWAVFWVLLVEALVRGGTRDEPARWGRRGPPADEADDDTTLRADLEDMLDPRTSILFLAVDERLSAEAVRGLTRLGGVLVTWGLPGDVAHVARAGLSADSASVGSRRRHSSGAGSSRDAASRPRRFSVSRGTCGSV